MSITKKESMLEMKSKLSEFNYECLMPIEDYRDCIKTGCIIDYDGCGTYVDDNGKECGDSDFSVKEINKKIKQGIHWVCWYNK